MEFNTLELILGSSKPTDWLFDIDNGIYTYKLDVELNILTKHPDDPNSSRELKEDWMDNYQDKTAWMLIAKVYYSGAFVKHYLFARADGDRIIIGLPNLPELEITRLEYNMGKILSYRNVEGNLTDYDPRFRLSGIEVK